MQASEARYTTPITVGLEAGLEAGNKAYELAREQIQCRMLKPLHLSCILDVIAQSHTSTQAGAVQCSNRRPG